MVLRVNSPPFKLSEYTTEDSDGNAMLKAHAYRAQSAGVAYANVMLALGNHSLRIYVGLTNDPEGAGLEIQRHSITATASDEYVPVQAEVAKGEYFEILSESGTPAIKWKSFGTLKKPIDFN